MLKLRLRPAVSLNTTRPATTPVPVLGLPTVAVPATGVPGSTATVTIWAEVRTPLLAVTVNVSVVVEVAAKRCA